MPGLSAIVTTSAITGFGFALLRIKKNLLSNAAIIIYILWVLGFYIIIEKSTAKPYPWFVRYIFPAIPGFTVFAGFGLDKTAELIKKFKISPKVSIAFIFILFAGSLATPLVKSLLILSAVSPGSKQKTAEWTAKNLPAGSEVLIDHIIYGPQLSPEFNTHFKNICSSGKYAQKITKQKEDFVIINSFSYGRYFLNEDKNPAIRHKANCYRWLNRHCRLLKTIAPKYQFQTYGFHNQVIKIYDLQSCKKSGLK
jgi:hypothetical protein